MSNGPNVWVCVPTYNESENLESLVRAALASLEAAGVEACALVIDDNSPDGTGELADALAADDERIEVLHRARKEGIGPAYRAGFGRALIGGADRIIEMDCDFSHDPDDLPRLVAATEQAHLALGSRYVTGGRVEDWGLVRRGISRFGCLYARRVLGIPIRDLTGGFKCFRREVLEAIPLDDVAAAGYGFQVEMTYRAYLEGFRITEVPITFKDRRRGSSKMSKRIVMEAAVLVPSLRRRLGRGGRSSPRPIETGTSR